MNVQIFVFAMVSDPWNAFGEPVNTSYKSLLVGYKTSMLETWDN